MLYEIKNGSVMRGGEPVLKGFDFAIRGTEKIAIVGRNGAGKTSLLKVLTGELPLEGDAKDPTSGISRARQFTIGVLHQEAVRDPEMTVEDCILGAFRTGEEELYSRERFDFELRYDRIFTGLGFALDDKRKKLREFSGGEQTKIMLIRELLAEPDVLILDEPTNHLDIDAVMWLERYLKTYPKAVVTVSHDRYFIDEIADTVIEVAGGRLVRYAGNYTAYRKEKLDRLAKQKKAYEAQQEEIKRLNELIERFKHKPRKAAFARSRAKILERMEMIGKPDPDEAVIHTGEILPLRSGSKWVFECEDLVIGYGKNEPVRKLSFRIRRGAKIGVFGPNGAGKTTFLKTVAGILMPIGGKMKTGENIDAVYFDQKSAEIRSDRIVLDWFLDKFPSMMPADAKKILAGFLFRGEDMGKKVSDLSGGEKARLVLASVLEERPNFLILDEPTNNMDIPAQETLESILRDYKGTLLVVSHDRYLLSRVAESLLVFEPGTTEVLYYPNDYRHYAERKKRVDNGEDADVTRTAEEQRLIEGLRSVPKPEKGMLRTISDKEQEKDWLFAMNRTERKAAEERYRIAMERLRTAEEYVPDSEEEYEAFLAREIERTEVIGELRKEAEDAAAAYTAVLLSWYDIYLDV